MWIKIIIHYSPLTINWFALANFDGGVAQLARAPALQAGGQEFDSPHLHQHIEKYIDKDEKVN